jgi:hypothetical protein
MGRNDVSPWREYWDHRVHVGLAHPAELLQPAGLPEGGELAAGSGQGGRGSSTPPNGDGDEAFATSALTPEAVVSIARKRPPARNGAPGTLAEPILLLRGAMAARGTTNGNTCFPRDLRHVKDIPFGASGPSRDAPIGASACMS